MAHTKSKKKPKDQTYADLDLKRELAWDLRSESVPPDRHVGQTEDDEQMILEQLTALQKEIAQLRTNVAEIGSTVTAILAAINKLDPSIGASGLP